MVQYVSSLVKFSRVCWQWPPLIIHYYKYTLVAIFTQKWSTCQDFWSISIDVFARKKKSPIPLTHLDRLPIYPMHYTACQCISPTRTACPCLWPAFRLLYFHSLTPNTFDSFSHSVLLQEPWCVRSSKRGRPCSHSPKRPQPLEWKVRGHRERCCWCFWYCC